MMNRAYLKKVLHDPVGAMRRVVFKTLIGPFLYKKGQDYDAEKYWSDRLKRYGLSLKGPGDEGFSEIENQKVYERAGATVLETINSNGTTIRGAEVLDIGVGNGFYAELCLKQKPRSYLGLDITDALFEKVQEKIGVRSNENFRFKRLDITTENIMGSYDVILFIDVIEHIVVKEKLDFALKNIQKALKPGGLLLLTPVAETTRAHLFHNSEWGLESIKPHFEGYSISPFVPFRDSRLIALKKPQA